MSLSLSTQGLARASGRNPWTVIAVWIVVLPASGAIIAALLDDALTTEFGFTHNPESKRAFELVKERHKDLQQANEIVIVSSPTMTVKEEGFESKVEHLYGKITALGPDVIQVGTHFYQFGDESLVSADQRATIMPFVMAGDFNQATDNIERVMGIVEEADGDADFHVLIAGNASIAQETNEVSERDLLRGEAFAIPVAMVILVLVFGALVAALVPVVLAIVSITVALGAAAIIGQGFGLSFFVVNMITMMGLAVGIDYSLFIVARFREERAKGLENVDAIAAAGGTASRAVFFSGMTVVLALVGLVIVPSTVFQSLGLGAILVVLAAMMASLTLLPAILGLLGDRVNALRVPILGRRMAGPATEGRGGFWDWITHGVMRHPWISLVVTAGIPPGRGSSLPRHQHRVQRCRQPAR